jgi:hypothetical protein
MRAASPVVCPIASRTESRSACKQHAFCSHMPANDFPWFSQSVPHPASSHERRFTTVAQDGRFGVPCSRGEAACCPVARPLGRAWSDQLVLPSTSAVPANDRSNRMRPELVSGGGI